MTSHRLPAIIVTDSTLGDAPAALSKRNQIDIALALEQAGIDEIELSAQGPIEHIGAALFASQTVIAGPATKGTVDAALRAGFDAVNLSLSLRTGRTPLLATIKRVVGYATKRGLAVALSGEDASRTDIDLVFAVIAAAKSAGARRFRYADTTGVLHPVRTHCVFRQLCAETDLELEFRGHDHFGLAIANTLAAIQGGATHISVSENTSETGPARLGSVVDAIQLATPHHTRVDTARLPALSALVAASTPWRPSTNRVSSKYKCQGFGARRQRADMPLADRAQPGLWRQIREDVVCVKARNPAARFTLEIVLIYPGVHAVLFYRIANRLWRARCRFLARSLSWFARWVSNVDIHPGATIGRRFFIDHGAGVVIGETAQIGNDVTMYHGVTLGGTSWSPGKRHPTVQDGVLIGAGAKILGPITIGHGVRVGANSVVIEDVPPDMTVVGIPGKIVRTARRRHRIDNRIDLEHHLMPDPVGDALSALIDRIEFLEARITEMQNSTGRARVTA